MNSWPLCKVCGSPHGPWESHYATYSIDAKSPEEAARKVRAVMKRMGVSGKITVSKNEPQQ